MVPSNGPNHLALGIELARLGKWSEAAAEYREALRIDPGNAEALTNLGFVYYELGMDEEAQEAFAQAEALRTPSEKCDPNRP